MYCLICTEDFLQQTDTMHDKCVTVRFEIAIFSTMGSCNTIGQQRLFGLDLLLQLSDGLCRQNQNASPKHSLLCMYRTILCPNTTTLKIPTTVGMWP